MDEDQRRSGTEEVIDIGPNLKDLLEGLGWLIFGLFFLYCMWRSE